MSSASSGSQFTALAAETTIDGTKVSLRIPTAMQPVDINDAVRGKLTAFALPSLKATYEGAVEYEKEKSKLHYYLYVGVGEAGPDQILPTRGMVEPFAGEFSGSRR